jgi:hypothetical protein
MTETGGGQTLFRARESTLFADTVAQVYRARQLWEGTIITATTLCQGILSDFNYVLGDLLAQFDGVERLMLGKAPQDRQLRA